MSDKFPELTGTQVALMKVDANTGIVLNVGVTITMLFQRMRFTSYFTTLRQQKNMSPKQRSSNRKWNITFTVVKKR
jgi:hypothetical protein